MKKKTEIEESWSITLKGKEVTKINVERRNEHFLKKGRSLRTVIKKRALTYSQIEPMIKYLGFNQKESAEFLEVDPATITRWKKDKKEIGKFRSKVLIDIDEIIAKGVRVFGSENQFKEWLNTINYALGDVRPIDLLNDPYGVELVDEAIDALSWGSFI